MESRGDGVHLAAFSTTQGEHRQSLPEGPPSRRAEASDPRRLTFAISRPARGRIHRLRGRIRRRGRVCIPGVEARVSSRGGASPRALLPAASTARKNVVSPLHAMSTRMCSAKLISCRPPKRPTNRGPGPGPDDSGFRLSACHGPNQLLIRRSVPQRRKLHDAERSIIQW